MLCDTLSAIVPRCMAVSMLADVVAVVCGVLRGGGGGRPPAADGGAAAAGAVVPVLLLHAGEAAACRQNRAAGTAQSNFCACGHAGHGPGRLCSWCYQLWWRNNLASWLDHPEPAAPLTGRPGAEQQQLGGGCRHKCGWHIRPRLPASGRCARMAGAPLPLHVCRFDKSTWSGLCHVHMHVAMQTYCWSQHCGGPCKRSADLLL